MEFLTLNELGKCKCWVSIRVRCFDNLYAGASCQLTIGLMGLFYLRIFINPFILGAFGFMLNNFHDSDLFITTLDLRTPCLIDFWNFSVGSLGILKKMVFFKKMIDFVDIIGIVYNNYRVVSDVTCYYI
jgi:hypothetical protein